MVEVIGLALEMYHATRGLFNPGILADLEAAGYDRSMDDIRASDGLASAGRPPAGFRRPLLYADFGQTRIDNRLGAVRLPGGLRVDLGGIAKGWIGQRAAEKLAQYSGAAMVDAGGDLYACGLPQGDGAWTVAIEDPLSPEDNAAVIRVGPGAVATSTTTRRRWKQRDQIRHHLINPATGLPAESQWISVTAVVPQNASQNAGAHAEALAKAMLIGGPTRAGELMRACPGSYFIVVDQAGKVWETLRGEPMRRV
jgi:thiamine biosynthesis lipoprotein